MRRVAIAALAVPVLAIVYLSAVLRRSVLARIGLSLGLGALIGIGVIGTSSPQPTAATPPSKHVPLTSVEFRTDLRTGLEPDAPIAIAFSTPMNERSVAAHLQVEPATAVAFDWDETATTLTVRPETGWATSTLHTITVNPGALAASGRPLSAPARAVFLTRAAVVASISATTVVGERVDPATSFLVSFDGPVDAGTVAAAFTIRPAVSGTFERLGRRQSDTWRFTPDATLAVNTSYELALASTVRDVAGARIDAPATLTVRTLAAPSVVRFRPVDGSTKVARDQTLSVRFSEAMDAATTRAAFTATAGGKAIDGRVTFAERGSVLVFDPTDALPYDTTVVVTVSGDARSMHGVSLATAATAGFRTVPKPAPPKPSASKSPKPAPTKAPTGGGSVGSGSWKAVESYYLRLMNCTRTGGWVTSTGSCSSPGGRNVAPLALSAGISDKVSRPYAKLLATKGQCTHFYGGKNPGNRLAAAGFTSYIWAENLGCRSGDPYKAVLGSHLYFQSEKSYNGGHYVNLMNAKYDRAGIGVWVSSGRVRLVVDFYHPR